MQPKLIFCAGLDASDGSLAQAGERKLFVSPMANGNLLRLVSASNISADFVPAALPDPHRDLQLAFQVKQMEKWNDVGHVRDEHDRTVIKSA